MRRICLILSLLGLGACGGGSGEGGPVLPSQPEPQLVLLGGEWTGSGVDSSGQATVEWSLRQQDNRIEGSVTVIDNLTGVEAFGWVTGELKGTTLLFTMGIPEGGWPKPQERCTAIAEGVASEVSNQLIRGTYEGENSCKGAFSNGLLRLTARPLLPVDDDEQIKQDFIDGAAME